MPSNSTAPEVGFCNPTITLPNVVFPLPLSPTRTTRSELSILRLTSFNAWTVWDANPFLVVKTTFRSRTEMDQSGDLDVIWDQLSVEVAVPVVKVAQMLERGLYLGTDLPGILATGMEPASADGPRRGRWIPRDAPDPSGLPMELGDSPEQGDGIGVRRRMEYLAGPSQLHHLAGIHHRHPLRESGDYRYVVRYEQHGDLRLLLNFFDEF